MIEELMTNIWRYYMMYIDSYIFFFQIKIVCKNLRKKNVTGHLGVFNEYFEPDNSWLLFISSKDLIEGELRWLFSQPVSRELDFRGQLFKAGLALILG